MVENQSAQATEMDPKKNGLAVNGRFKHENLRKCLTNSATKNSKNRRQSSARSHPVAARRQKKAEEAAQHKIEAMNCMANT